MKSISYEFRDICWDQIIVQTNPHGPNLNDKWTGVRIFRFKFAFLDYFFRKIFFFLKS